MGIYLEEKMQIYFVTPHIRFHQERLFSFPNEHNMFRDIYERFKKKGKLSYIPKYSFVICSIKMRTES